MTTIMREDELVRRALAFAEERLQELKSEGRTSHSQFQPQQHIPQTHCLSHENEQQENREGKREYLAEFGKKPTLQKIHSGVFP